MSGQPRTPANVHHAPSIPWAGRTHVSTFVRCLHLLDLDLLEDWPGISEQTFSTRSAQQNIQQRTKAAEWSLYRLFEKYAPQEARDKLRPFFPPLTPLQSLNLRAALLRALNELKKGGVLGKEISLRKTMLDECKGEKFEEVLSTFAMIVLRKDSSRRRPERSVFMNIDGFVAPQQSMYVPLVIAHRRSIQRCIKERRVIDGQIRAQRQILAEVSHKILERRTAVQKATKDFGPNQRRQVANVLKDSWSTDDRWIGALLDAGASHLQRAANLSLSAAEGSADPILGMDTDHDALLEELNARIEKHQQRLRKWQHFRQSLPSQEDQTEPETRISASLVAPSIRFDKHKAIRQGTVRESLLRAETIESTMHPSYRDLLLRMESEMNWKSLRSRPGQSLDAAETLPLLSPTTPASSTLVNPGEVISQSASQRSAPEVEMSGCLDTHAEVEEVSETMLSLGNESSECSWIAGINTKVCEPHSTETPESPIQHERHEPVMEAILQGNLDDSGLHAPISSPGRAKTSVQPAKQETELDVIDSVVAATEVQDEVNTKARDPPLHAAATGTLMDRTRLSMAMFSNTPQAKPALERRTKDKRSSQIFPVNQFETPRVMKTLPMQSPTSGDSTPRDKLFEEEADYASVFKSRPRIAMSPVLSPDRSTFDLESVLESGMKDIDLGSDRG